MDLRAVISCAVGLAGACAPTDLFEIPPVRWSGEHLDYAPQPNAEPVCAGTLPYMDRYMALAGDAMGVEVGRSVYVHGSADDPALCPAIGCVHAGSVIYSRLAPHEHELIHRVRAFENLGFRFFEEGAAEAFGEDDPANPDRFPATEPLIEGIESCGLDEPLADRWYPRAGHFFAYLHRVHGADVTHELLRSAPVESTPAEAVAALERATEMSFEDLVADYEDADHFCDQARWYRYPLFPCDEPEALRPRCAGGRAVPISVTLDCDDATTLGPRYGHIFAYVAIDIPHDGYYRITGVPHEEAYRGGIELKQCALGCTSRKLMRSYNELDTEVWLTAGRYSLRFKRDADATELASMTITIAGDDCR